MFVVNACAIVPLLQLSVSAVDCPNRRESHGAPRQDECDEMSLVQIRGSLELGHERSDRVAVEEAGLPHKASGQKPKASKRGTAALVGGEVAKKWHFKFGKALKVAKAKAVEKQKAAVAAQREANEMSKAVEQAERQAHEMERKHGFVSTETTVLDEVGVQVDGKAKEKHKLASAEAGNVQESTISDEAAAEKAYYEAKLAAGKAAYKQWEAQVKADKVAYKQWMTKKGFEGVEEARAAKEKAEANQLAESFALGLDTGKVAETPGEAAYKKAKEAADKAAYEEYESKATKKNSWW